MNVVEPSVGPGSASSSRRWRNACTASLAASIAVGVELDLPRGQHVVVDVVAFGRGCVHPPQQLGDVGPVHRLPHPQRSVRLHVDPQAVGHLEQDLGAAAPAPLPHAERDPRPLQGPEVVLGGAEPDPETPGELRGGQGLGAEEVEHPDARRVRQRPHRRESRDAMRESTGRRPLRWHEATLQHLL